jgi:hypothetical protein
VTHRPVAAQPPGVSPSAEGVPGPAGYGQPTASVAPAKEAADFTLFTNTDGTLVRWNPCLPIHYAVNVAEAGDPANASSDVRTAVGEVASATGLTFVYDGATTSVPTKAWLDGGTSAGATQPALVIAWARPGTASGDSDLFGTDADGEGGWWESGTSDDGVHWVWQIKRGFVVIDPRGAADYAPGFGNGESLGVLLMHELGHAVGLGHTDNQRDVMFPVITAASRPVWGPGDLVGLARVGTGAGCIPK